MESARNKKSSGGENPSSERVQSAKEIEESTQNNQIEVSIENTMEIKTKTASYFKDLRYHKS